MRGGSISISRHLFLMAAAGLVVGMISTTVAAAAHPSGEYYNAKWGSNRLTDGVKWRFTQNVPSGNTRDRLRDAATTWNNQNQAMAFNFEQNQNDYQGFSASACPGGGDSQAGIEKDAVHWGAIGGAAIGFTVVCTFQEAGGTASNSYHSFQIKMDSNVSWHTGASAPGQNDTDIQGAATHEFGHATGREVGGADGSGHFGNSWSVCNNTDNEHHTMCQTVIVNRDWDRTLNTHDKDVFDGAY